MNWILMNNGIFIPRNTTNKDCTGGVTCLPNSADYACGLNRQWQQGSLLKGKWPIQPKSRKFVQQGISAH